MSNTWTLELDHADSFTGPFHSDAGDVQAIRLALASWYAGTPDDTNVQVAIDNVLIGTGRAPPPPTLSCPAPIVLECTNSASGILQVDVADTSASPVPVVWAVDGMAYQTNQ